jgi:hypothetical protein
MADHEVLAAPITLSEPSTEVRLAALEARLAQQEAELTVLRAGRATDATAPALPDADPPTAPATTAQRGRKGTGARSSRRALLKLGGAAAAAGVAAAGVAAVAAGATELTHPGTAHAVPAHRDSVSLYESITGGGNIAIQGDGLGGALALWGNGVGGGAGVQANSDLNNALYAETHGTGTAGVYGVAIGSGRGVVGDTTVSSGVGVFGISAGISSGVLGQSLGAAAGVHGTSTDGYGVFATSTNYVGAAFEGPIAQIWLHGNPGTTPPASGFHGHGMIFADQNGTLWVCIADGTPGTWVRLTGVPSGAHGGATTYLSTPLRLLDARTSPGTALVTRGPLAANETYAFTVAGLGGSGIPAGAQGLIGNLTVLGPSGAGNLSLFPAGTVGPSVASMTFGTPGLFLANGVNVAIGSGGKINIQNQSSGTTPLVLDAVAFVS